AGANQVVSPYNIGGQRMAMLALPPLAGGVFDSIFPRGGTRLLLEDGGVRVSPPPARRTVDQVQSELAPGASLLAINHNTAILPRPAPDVALQVGDELVAIGTSTQLRLLERLT